MTIKTNQVFFVLLFCFCSSNLMAQNKKIDSLVTLLQNLQNDTNKVLALNELALQYRQLGNHEKAIQTEKIAIPIAKELNFKKGEAQAYGNLGLLLRDLGKNIDAINVHHMALELRKSIDDWQGLGNSYTNLGHIHLSLSNTDSAKFYYLNALRVREHVKDEYGMGNAFHDLGNVSNRTGDLSGALRYHLSALEFRERIRDLPGIANSYGSLGQVFNEQSNFPEALKNYKKSVEYAELIKDKRLVANAFTGMGVIFAKHGNLAEALKNYYSALKINLEIANKRGIANAYNNIALILIKQGNYKEALENFWSAISLYGEIGFKNGQIRSYNNVGLVYYDRASSTGKQEGSHDSNLDSASKYFTIAITLSEEIKDKSGLSQSYFNLAGVKRSKLLFSESLKTYRKALNIFEEIPDRLGVEKSFTAIAKVLIDSAQKSNSTKEYDEAITHATKGLAIARELQAKEDIKVAYENLAEAHKGRKDYKQALVYTALSTEMGDSIINTETARKLESLRIQYEVEKATADEKAKQETHKTQMKLAFDRREDSIKYEQKLTSLQLTQQTYISRQQEQDLKLKQVSLDLAHKQNELNRLNYLKSQAELETEQTKREEKEQELTIANQEKSLQTAKLKLQQTQLNLKESQIHAERKQRLFYIGGIILLLLLFVFIYRTIKSRQRIEKLVAAERLRSEKASAAHKMAELELQSLRAQLNPHFMFNSLNAIQELILKEDNDNSHLYLSRFSDLLRMLLENANQPFVPLRKEINFLELYLSLENLRIPDLKYSIEVDPLIDSNKVVIPNMMLQPYIENAIWHGLSHKKAEKNINIRMSKNESGIVCEVEDNGVGRKMATELKSLYRKEHRSRGMELLSKRFNLLSKEYGSDIHTKVEDLHDNGTATGTRVAITVPYSLTKQPEPVFS